MHIARHADNAAAGSDRHASHQYNSSSQPLACCEEEAALEAICTLLANNTSCQGKPWNWTPSLQGALANSALETCCGCARCKTSQAHMHVPISDCMLVCMHTIQGDRQWYTHLDNSMRLHLQLLAAAGHCTAAMTDMPDMPDMPDMHC
jgi:hypothetical protein